MQTDVQLFEDRLVVERHFKAAPEKIWQYLTDPALRQKWFCAGATDAHEGGTIVFDFDHSRISKTAPSKDGDCADAVTFEGTITDYDPPHRFGFTWPEQDGDGTHVLIRLRADQDGTHLHLEHSKLKRDDYKSGAAAGWHTHLDLLVDLTNGEEARDFWVHYRPLEARYKEKVEAQATA